MRPSDIQPVLKSFTSAQLLEVMNICIGIMDKRKHPVINAMDHGYRLTGFLYEEKLDNLVYIDQEPTTDDYEWEYNTEPEE